MKLGGGKLCARELVQPTQDGGGVGRAACHARTDGNILFEHDMCAGVIYSGTLKKAVCRTNGEVALIARDKVQIALGTASCVLRERYRHLIAQRDRLHDHEHLMVAVGAAACHIKRDIYFCVGFFGNIFHLSNSILMRLTPEFTCGPRSPLFSVYGRPPPEFSRLSYSMYGT